MMNYPILFRVINGRNILSSDELIRAIKSITYPEPTEEMIFEIISRIKRSSDSSIDQEKPNKKKRKIDYKMTIASIKKELDDRKVSYDGLKRKDELLKLLSDTLEAEDNNNKNSNEVEIDDSEVDVNTIHIILSDDLHWLPIEMLPIMKTEFVYRLPSLEFGIMVYKV